MLEVKIEELTKAVIALTELIGKIEADKSEPVIAASVVASPAPALIAPDPVPALVPASVIAAPAPVMPAAPTFEPVAAPAANTAPFTDGKGLIGFVMEIYKELGQEKGAAIQNVLVEMGLSNVNEVRPSEYDTFYQKVIALRG